MPNIFLRDFHPIGCTAWRNPISEAEGNGTLHRANIRLLSDRYYPVMIIEGSLDSHLIFRISNSTTLGVRLSFVDQDHPTCMRRHTKHDLSLLK